MISSSHPKPYCKNYQELQEKNKDQMKTGKTEISHRSQAAWVSGRDPPRGGGFACCSVPGALDNRSRRSFAQSVSAALDPSPAASEMLSLFTHLFFPGS